MSRGKEEYIFKQEEIGDHRGKRKKALSMKKEKKREITEQEEEGKIFEQMERREDR